MSELLAGGSILTARDLHFQHAGDGRSKVLCGFLGSDRRAFAPLFAALPALFRVRYGEAAQDLLRYAVATVRREAPGAHALRLRVAELLFVEALRQYLAQLPDDATGWLAGLRDPLVGRALSLLHRDPARAWNVDRLARAVDASRSALASRFSTLIGEAPMHYLTRLRLQRAAQRLRDTACGIDVIAAEVGYASSAAFQRAFKRSYGAPPGAWRRAR